MERIKTLTFAPGIKIEFDKNTQNSYVKGKRPLIDYGFQFSEIYSEIPSLDIFLAHKHIAKILLGVDKYINARLSVHRTEVLHSVQNEMDARQILELVFGDFRMDANKIGHPAIEMNRDLISLFSLKKVSPFPLKDASKVKLVDSLFWIDSNIKINAETFALNLQLKELDIRIIVKSAFEIFSYLLKAEAYFLALNINFNYSMAIQERILHVLFRNLGLGFNDFLLKEGRLNNRIALEMLRQYTVLSPRRVVDLATFMGVAWANHQMDKKGGSGRLDFDSYLAELEKHLNMEGRLWEIDHFDHFMKDLQPACETQFILAVILDDNGESIFDLAFIQILMKNFSYLNVALIVNAYPISNNISFPLVEELLDDHYFKELFNFFSSGRLKIVVERQRFRSFELSHLFEETRNVLMKSNLLYVKGANFFETLQLVDISRYYCFTVFSLTSQILTGCKKNSGVFAKVPAGRTGYIYYDEINIVTLKDIANKID
ncbi:MAG: hypothetical protein KIPDCIKN_01339 [Haliscomenobacter sp.]|nr:hypothetical protein [Haliscomenobacter sp.]